MAKGKPKSKIAPNVKAAVGTAALLASGASAKGLRESGAGNEEVVVASAHISSKQGLNDDPPPNLTVVEKVIAETAPFQMIRQMRSMEEYAKADETGGGMVRARVAMETDSDSDADDSEKAKKKKEKKKKKEGKKKDKKSMEEYAKADETVAGLVTATGATATVGDGDGGADEERELKTKKEKKEKKSKKEKKEKKEKKSKKKVRQLGMEPPEADDSDSNEDELKVKGKKRFRWI